jgi:hypothetical protein
MACGPRWGLGPPWTAAVRPRAQWRTHQSTACRCYGSPAVTVRGGGGRGGRGGVRGALTGDRAAVKRPGDGGKAVAIEGAQWGRAPVSGVVRRGRGTFYRC